MSKQDRAASQHRDHLFDLAQRDGFEVDEFLREFRPSESNHEVPADADKHGCWDYTLRYDLHHRNSLSCATEATSLSSRTDTYARVVDIGCGSGGASSYLASERTGLVNNAEFIGIDHCLQMRRLYIYRGARERWSGKAYRDLSEVPLIASQTLAVFAFVAGQPTFSEVNATDLAKDLLRISHGPLDVLMLTATGQVGRTAQVLSALSEFAAHEFRPFEASSDQMICPPIFLDGYAPAERFHRPTPSGANLRWGLIRIGGARADIDVRT